MAKSSHLILFTIVVSMSFFGLLISFSMSSFSISHDYGVPYYYVKKQSIALALGLVLLVTASQIPYRLWYHLAWFLYAVSLVLLSLVFVESIGKEAGGASRWLQIGGLSFQPSDLSRFAGILLLARLYSKKGEHEKNTNPAPDWFKNLLGLLVIALPAVLIGLEPDFGTAIHFVFTCLVLLFCTSFPFTILLALGILAAPAVYYNIVKVPWRLKRIIAFLDPWKYRYEEGYQLVAAFKSFWGGGLWGKGMGEGIIRHKLQARHTDFILSVIAEDIGFIGLCLVLLSFLFLITFILLKLRRLEDPFAFLLGLGIVFLFTFQCMIHIAVNMGLLPTTGMNLPLVSYGGTSLVIYLFMFGVLLNLWKTGNSQGVSPKDSP